jgi:hypothetical protein
MEGVILKMQVHSPKMSNQGGIKLLELMWIEATPLGNARGQTRVMRIRVGGGQRIVSA